MSKIKLTEDQIKEQAKSAQVWFESDEGQQVLKAASDRVKKVSEEFDNERRIDPELLRKQFTL